MNPEVSSPASIASVAFAIRNLALKSIEPSGTPVQERRRTHYDPAALKELAANIKAARLEAGLTQRHLAERLGVDSMQVSKWERAWR